MTQNIINNIENNDLYTNAMPTKIYGIISGQGMGITDNPAQLSAFIVSQPDICIKTFCDIFDAYRWCCTEIIRIRQMRTLQACVFLPDLNSFRKGNFINIEDMIYPTSWSNLYKQKRYFVFCSESDIGILTVPENIITSLLNSNSAIVIEFDFKEQAEAYAFDYMQVLLSARMPYSQEAVKLYNETMRLDTLYSLPINLSPEGRQIWEGNFLKNFPIKYTVKKEVISFLPQNNDALLPKK